MMGGAIKRSSSTEKVWVRHTEEVTVETAGVVPLPKDHITGVAYTAISASEAHPIRLINLTTGVRTQLKEGSYAGSTGITFKNDAAGVSGAITSAGDIVRVFWEEEVATDDAAVEITISPNTFPGTYRIVGDTFIRSQKTGADEAFQFIINKAKQILAA